MRRLPLSIVTTLCIAFLAACGGGATPAPSSGGAPAGASSPAGASAGAGASSAAAACAAAPAGAAATVNVSIKDFKFSPQPVQAKVGDVIAWKNDDTAPHSATMDSAGCDTDSINPGSAAMLVFTAPGTYTYHCKVHPTQMKDYSVVVQ
jgi:plastocyanin